MEGMSETILNVSSQLYHPELVFKVFTVIAFKHLVIQIMLLLYLLQEVHINAHLPDKYYNFIIN